MLQEQAHACTWNRKSQTIPYYILHDRTGSEVIQLLDVISTNVTHFQESTHFNFRDSSRFLYHLGRTKSESGVQQVQAVKSHTALQ